MSTEGALAAPPTPEADYQEEGSEETESDSAESDSDSARPRRKRKQMDKGFEKWFAPVRDDWEHYGDDPTQGKLSDWITDTIELTERQRLREWYWMDALDIDVVRDHGWLGWSYTPKSNHPLKMKGSVPKWLSAASLQKLLDDTFDPDDRELTTEAKAWLRNYWVPVIETHRAWLTEKRKHELDLLDASCWREEAEKSKSAKMKEKPMPQSTDKMKKAKEKRQEQLMRNRSYYASATKGKPLNLKWVPKLHPYNVVLPAEASGLTAEVPRDITEADFGRSGVLSATDVANLKA